MTVSPYLGTGSLQPFVDTARTHGAGVFVLALTSNPEAPPFQQAVTADGTTVAGSVLAALRELNAGTDGPLGAPVTAEVEPTDEPTDEPTAGTDDTTSDEADDAIVGASEVRQLAGEGAVGVGVDQLTLASRAAYQSSHRSAGDAAV